MRHTSLFLGLLVLLGCTSESPTHDRAQSASPSEISSKEILKLLGGEETAAMIQNADTVKAYRQPPESYFQKSLDEFKILSGPVVVSESSVTKLTKTLLDHDSYIWDLGKGCEPDYGVRIEFTQGDEKVDFLFCFGCSQLAVFRNGKYHESALFDPSAKSFGKQMKSIFPDDKIIQSLEE